MFDTLLRQLLGPRPAPLATFDARLALATLLVRVARADDDYAASEVARIDRVLAQNYRLSPDAAAALRREAEALEAQAPDTVRFTRALKETVALADRQALLEALWAVALADGGRAAEEEQLLRLIANLLGLTDVESALARQKAQDGPQ